MREIAARIARELDVGAGSRALSRVGLRLPDDLEYDAWYAIGVQVVRLSNASTWALADWLFHGDGRYGAKYADAIAALGLEYQTCANMVWVRGRFDFSRRRENLSFSHHAEVARMPIDEGDDWLDRALREGWSQKRLREEIHGPPRLPLPSVVVRGTPLEVKRWQGKAEEVGLTLAEWLRRVANAAS